ncbi:MAG: peptidase S9 [bacterium]|nr:peptidase S9 [bacterium]
MGTDVGEIQGSISRKSLLVRGRRRGKRGPALFVLLAVVLLGGTGHAAAYDPGFRFRTIETPRFSIHYHQGLDNVATRVARIAETVHGRMVDAFRWSPQEKTQVVLVDSSDFANGFAGSLPYNAMVIITVPPTLDSMIGEYGDWLEDAFIHEYAHILTSDPSRGYAGFMRRIFGKPVPAGDLFSLLVFLVSAPPNTFLPRWWHEGMATWAETDFTGHGRGRSVFFDMVFRMAVHDGNLPPIDRINEDLPFWPDGHMPYLWGWRLQRHIVARYGEDALGKRNQGHAWQFPYFLNGIPEWILEGKSYKDLYREMLAELQREQGERIAALEAAPLTSTRILAVEGEQLTHPRFSPDGKRIAFHLRDPHRHEAIGIIGADGSGRKDVVRRLPSDQSLAWSPDGRTLYYTQADFTGFDYDYYQDLYAHELESGKERRLTRGLRVGEPDPSPDGTSFAVVLSRRGSRNLSILRRKPGDTVREAWYPADNVTDYPLAKVSDPRWSPDGTRVVYAVAENDGRRRLELYDASSGKVSRLFESDAPIASPAWSRDGKTILFVSGETGVFNIFALRQGEAEPVRVTHLLGGAFHPDVSPGGDEIVFTSYTSRGFRLETIPYQSGTRVENPGRGSSASRREGGAGISTTNARGDDASGPSMPAGPAKAYSPLATLFPRFWLPTLYGDVDGAVVGAMTAGQDVLGYHTFLLNPAVGTTGGRVYFQGKYVYDRYWPTLSGTAWSLPVLYSDLQQRGDYYERNSSLILRADLPWIRGESRYLLSFGYHLQRQDALTDIAGTALQGLQPFEGRRDNLFVETGYSNAVRYPYSISYEEGRTLSATFRNYSGRAGSDVAAREYLGSWEEYLSLPASLPRHHVVAMRLGGGISDGERTTQNSFRMGGPPDTLLDFPLRGYPSRFQAGKYVATGTLEYRMPVYYLFRGPGTAPVFLDRMHAAAFVDAGEAWGDGVPFSGGRVKVGAGVEARADLTLGYWLKIEPAIGFAWGFNEGGEAQAYFTIGVR